MLIVFGAEFSAHYQLDLALQASPSDWTSTVHAGLVGVLFPGHYLLVVYSSIRAEFPLSMFAHPIVVTEKITLPIIGQRGSG